MIVGCYSLDLYCDSAWSCSGQADGFTGRNRTQATKEAKKDGWRVTHAREGKTGRAICPDCNDKGLK